MAFKNKVRRGSRRCNRLLPHCLMLEAEWFNAVGQGGQFLNVGGGEKVYYSYINYNDINIT